MSAIDDFPDIVIPLEAALVLNQWLEFCEERGRLRIQAAKKEGAVEQTALSSTNRETDPLAPLYTNKAADAKGGEQ